MKPCFYELRHEVTSTRWWSVWHWVTTTISICNLVTVYIFLVELNYPRSVGKLSLYNTTCNILLFCFEKDEAQLNILNCSIFLFTIKYFLPLSSCWPLACCCELPLMLYFSQMRFCTCWEKVDNLCLTEQLEMLRLQYVGYINVSNTE